MLRSKFDDELEKLHNQFYAMGTEVLSQINKTVQAFISMTELAKEVIEGDEVVNNFETKLEKNLSRLSLSNNLYHKICVQLSLF